MSAVDPQELVELAVDLARRAGELLLDYADARDLVVETKSSDTDPVSEADRAAEQLIVDGLAAERPHDAMLGEEDHERGGSSGLRWVFDPLDGTVNYLYGIPAWCVSIACEDDDGVLVGAVHDPSHDETFAAVRGGETTLDSHTVRVREVDLLERALVATGFSYDPAVRAAQGQWAAGALSRMRDLRRVGAAALDLAWLSAGRLDGFYEFGLQSWDHAAGRLLVASAGGHVSRHRARLAGVEGDLVIAGSMAIHDALVDWLDPQMLHEESLG